MNRSVPALFLGGAAALAMPAAPAFAAPQVEIAAQNPIVELSVSEQVEERPDLALFGAGVQTQAMSAREAMRLNAEKAQRMIDRLKALGIASKDIQTSGLNLHARYDHRGNASPRFIGYQVSNEVRVKVRDIDRMGALLDAAVEAGANRLNGPFFTVEDDDDAKELARGRAFDRGRERALYYARRAGYSDVRLLSVQESVSGRGPVPPMPIAMVAEERAEMRTPVEPGRVSVSVNLHLQYEMTR